MDDVVFRAGLAAGTDPAFRELHQRHARSMFVVCKRVLGNDRDAEEAMQDAFGRAYEKRRQLAVAVNLKGYVVTMAHHMAVDRVRKEHRRGEIDRERPDAPAATARSPGDAPSAAERRALAECIEKLDPATQELVHALGEGDTWETIGALAKLTADAARMRVNRGLRALRACLRRKGVSI